MQKLRRFARYWDLVANSGNFRETTPLLWRRPSTDGSAGGEGAGGASPFSGFMRWSEWLHGRVGRTDSIALVRLMELLFTFLTQETGCDSRVAAQALWRDYQRGARRDKPAFLKDHLNADEPARSPNHPATPKRQARHLA
jgi:hypothetical protein